ncbi:MAG: hypothetical protein IJ572_04280 [Bacilli bacterium]|nr:hypothetical protein [Bacilli bacterium]
MNKIIVNKIKCKKCGDIIESTHRHDFKFCKCGAVAVDGGKDYLRRLGNEDDYEELFEAIEVEEEDKKDE